MSASTDIRAQPLVKGDPYYFSETELTCPSFFLSFAHFSVPPAWIRALLREIGIPAVETNPTDEDTKIQRIVEAMLVKVTNIKTPPRLLHTHPRILLSGSRLLFAILGTGEPHCSQGAAKFWTL